MFNRMLTAIILQAIMMQASHANSSQQFENEIVSATKKYQAEGYELYRTSHLEGVAKGYYFIRYRYTPPGYYCDDLVAGGGMDCVVVLVKNMPESKGELMLFLIKEIDTEYSKCYEIDRFTSASYTYTHIFLRPFKGGRVNDREKGSVVDVFQRGVELVFFEKSKKLYFWEGNELRSVWTED